MITTKDFNTVFTNNYEKYLNITKNLDAKNAYEILHTTALTLLTQKKAFDTKYGMGDIDRIIIMNLYSQFYSKHSKYNKTTNNYFVHKGKPIQMPSVALDDEENDVQLIFSDDDEDLKDKINFEIHLHQIKDTIKELRANKKIDWYDQKIYEMYYYPQLFNIEGKMTYRRLENITGITHAALFTTVKTVEKKIREQIQKKDNI